MTAFILKTITERGELLRFIAAGTTIGSLESDS